MSEQSNEIQAALNAGMGLAQPQPIDNEGRFLSVAVPAGGSHKVIDLEKHLDEFRDRPRRKAGHVTVYDADSFLHYYRKHAVAATETYADVRASKITAVINAHTASLEDDGELGLAGWGDHRVTLSLQHTPTWLVWMQNDRMMLTQLEFANHIEDQVAAIINPEGLGLPSGADMLEVAQSLSVNRKVSFESAQKLSSNERTLHYREDDTAAGGKKGSLAIPEKFAIAVQPYEGGQTYKVNARLRYSMNEGQLLLGYYLERPDEVLRSAFLDVRTSVEDGINVSTIAGVPDGRAG